MKKISKEIRKYDEWMDKKYAKRDDKDNILPVEMTDAEFCEWAMTKSTKRRWKKSSSKNAEWM